jgi:hypothetical protein
VSEMIPWSGRLAKPPRRRAAPVARTGPSLMKNSRAPEEAGCGLRPGHSRGSTHHPARRVRRRPQHHWRAHLCHRPRAPRAARARRSGPLRHPRRRRRPRAPHGPGLRAALYTECGLVCRGEPRRRVRRDHQLRGLLRAQGWARSGEGAGAPPGPGRRPGRDGLCAQPDVAGQEPGAAPRASRDLRAGRHVDQDVHGLRGVSAERRHDLPRHGDRGCASRAGGAPRGELRHHQRAARCSAGGGGRAPTGTSRPVPR